MKNIAVRKIRNNDGASLTFALLLFLVCSVIGTIVLTAATVASGRLADKAETDKRYYRVVSVAEFLRDELDEKKIVITRTKNEDNSISILFDGDLYVEGSSDFLTSRTHELLDANDLWGSDFFCSVSHNNNFYFNIQNLDELISVDTTVKNGSMIIDVTDDRYTVRLSLSPIISEVSSITEGKETKVSTVTWKVIKMEKMF